MPNRVSCHVGFQSSVILVALLSLLPGSLLAGPAAPDIHLLRQPDGLTFEARQWGDEWLSGWETRDGFTIALDTSSNTWMYAQRRPDGSLAPSTEAVGLASPPLEGARHLRPSPEARERALAPASAPPGGGERAVVPPTGTASVPLILVNFSDTTTSHTPSEFNNLLFGNATWSMRDYYTEVSYGAFTVSAGPGGVAGWFQAPKGHDYYGDDEGSTKDYWVADLVYEAVQAADQAGFDFAPYDLNGDCFVDSVNIVHQGPGQDASGNESDIWAKSSGLAYRASIGASHYPEVYTSNDVCPAGGLIKVDRFVIQAETYGSGLTTMGVFAHEYGHALGLPDLYDTDGSSEGVGEWSLMGSGSWCQVSRGGDRPSHMDPWSKVVLGWVTPRLVSGTLTSQAITQAATAASVFQLLPGNPSSGGEYFLVENRQLTRFDAGLPGSGLVIWHIDESQQNNTKECYPGGPSCASQHFRVAVVQADNQWDLEHNNNRGDGGDPYPGTFNNRSFTDTSSPSSSWYSGQSSGVSVTSIGASGATMTATLAAPSGNTLSVTKAGSGSGTVTSAPAGISCGSTCTASFTSGTSVTLTATPASGSTFGGWGGSCSGTGACTVTMTTTRAVTATFSSTSGGEVTVFADDFEGAFPGSWQFYVGASGCGSSCASTNWGRVSNQSASPTHSIWCAGGGGNPQTPGTTYVPNMGGWIYFGPFDLSDATDAWAEFDLWLATESNDMLSWNLSINDANYPGKGRTANTSGWEHVRFNFKDITSITTIGAPQVWLAFIFKSNASLQYEGAYIDNVVIKKTTAAPACTFTLNPASASPSAAGGAGTVAVTASSGSCVWTASSSASWISITGGASGTGSGTVSYSVQANTGAQRTGTLLIAGQSFTVTQAAGTTVSCTNSYWIPVGTRAAGSGGSNWRTDLGLLNIGAAAATVEVRALTGTSTLTRSLALATNASEITRDLLNWISAGFSGSASIQVCSSQPLLVMSRTYSVDSTGKTVGQGYDGLVAADTIGAGQSALLPMLTQNGVASQTGTYRTNIGVINTGTVAAVVQVTAYDATGAQVWTDARSYNAGDRYQYQEPFKAAGRTNIEKGYARVTVISGSGVFAYASVIDNGSNDPTTINMKK